MPNQKLFEINTRVWIKKFPGVCSLSEVPIDYFINLKERGFDYIWLMGIWKTSSELIEKCCYTPDLIMSYDKSLKDWKKEDVIGSPYAIDEYKLDERFGKEEDLLAFKKQLNKIGLKLILDFVPNHFSAATKYLIEYPEIFLQGDENILRNNSFTFFKHEQLDKVYAHGRDPFFPAWTDTVQVNYFNEEARTFMTNILLGIMKLCDGVRCDMAMLPLNNVFHNTWLGLLNKDNKPEKEFWEVAIKEVKKINPHFVFIAETYWDLEWEMQQLNFDFTYDKRLTDRLEEGHIEGIKSHLTAEINFQMRSVRFIENHDEQRAVSKFGKFRSLAAATVISTIPGLKLYYDGQFEGRKIKLPVQLGKEPIEKISGTVSRYYERILDITKHEIFRDGNWSMLNAIQAVDDTSENMLCWIWSLKDDIRLIVINYSNANSRCRIMFNFNAIGKRTIILKDLLTNELYERNVKEIVDLGLYVELKPYTSHIFQLI